MNGPWLLLGDFNIVLNMLERISYVDPPYADINEFVECVQKAHVHDLPRTGCFYTWCNKQEGDSKIQSKLDMAMGNTDWFMSIFYATAEYYHMGISDHSPTVVNIFEQANTMARPFKFLSCWGDHEDFSSIVSQTWGVQIEGCAMFRVVRKLKLLKKELRHLYRQNYHNIEARALEVQRSLFDAQKLVHDNPNDPVLTTRDKGCYENYIKIREVENHILIQRAKADMVTKTDNNTAYFHARLKERQSKGRIKKIIDKDGVTREGGI